MTQYNLIAENPESTVVAEYKPLYRRETTFQSEADLEKAFIEQLQTQAYEYLAITSEDELIANLRLQLEALNNYQFTNSEWEQFFKSKIANQNNGIEEKTTIIQEDHIQLLTRDDGTIKNIYLIDKQNIHNNKLQVINQYTVESDKLLVDNETQLTTNNSPLYTNRYDVTILVNGLPLVHIELKKRGVDIKEAFNQINRYNRESFWAGCGLFEYVQLFVISNGTYTKYYSNTTRFTHIRELGDGAVKKGKRTSNSFEFTSWWADANNRPITDLMDFGRTFFAKHTLLNLLTKYCVFTSDKLLLAMRSYQIVATERILNKIAISNNYKSYGTIDGGGYIWHTTGSGKTLTSFKTAQLASKLPFIEKVLFVVDRKDLDYQTMKEYDKFEKGAANSNSNTAILKKQLDDPNCRIIITTIQKLSVLIKKQKKFPLSARNGGTLNVEIPPVGRNDERMVNEEIPPVGRNDEQFHSFRGGSGGDSVATTTSPLQPKNDCHSERSEETNKIPLFSRNDERVVNEEIPPVGRNDNASGCASGNAGGVAARIPTYSLVCDVRHSEQSEEPQPKNDRHSEQSEETQPKNDRHSERSEETQPKNDCHSEQSEETNKIPPYGRNDERLNEDKNATQWREESPSLSGKSVISSEARNLFNQHIVIIFDECHRSQFGDMHTAITKTFKKYHLFGFTGTPIFAVNSNSNSRADLRTTEQAFGAKLHTYTIVDAITDKNVLPFRIDYISTMKEQENIQDEKVWNIDRERALLAPERISNIVKYIREHFDQKTKRNSFYQLKDRRLSGFNSIFAVSSIEAARKYYTEFQKQMMGLPGDKQLKVATIYSFGVNEDPENGIIDDENLEDTSLLDQSSRDFLESAIQDYNRLFKTNYDTSSDKFQNYYKDVSQRVKDREIDLLIVVNMFLTGFDATTLNTLWVDKNLRLHGLLQAYSRTNRILNTVKTFGNIVCFRNLEKATNESIALFGDKEAGGVVLLKTYDEYYNGYKKGDEDIPGYADLVHDLQEKFPLNSHCGLDQQSPETGDSAIQWNDVRGEQNQKDFIKLYSSILKVKNILSTFDEFSGNEILSERDVQDYHSIYINLYNDFRGKSKGDNENVNDDIVFEMELIKQVEINIDYILALIKKYHEGHLKDKEIVISISKAIDSSVELRNKKELIEQFIDSLTPSTNVDDDWRSFVDAKKVEELNQIINDENLDKEETYKFITNAFRDGYIQSTGTALSKVLPPVSRFSPTGDRTKKRESVLEKLSLFLDKFWDISGGMFLKN